MVGYQAQVIPAILAAFILVYLEKFWRRITPDYISMIIVPLFSLIPAVILAHTVVGPIGWLSVLLLLMLFMQVLLLVLVGFLLVYLVSSMLHLLSQVCII